MDVIAENRYKHEVLVDGEPVLFEISDSCPKTEEDLPSSETLNWADGLLLVYAITDRRSFNYVRRVKQMLCCDVPLALVGNKGDMVHLRQVSTEEVPSCQIRQVVDGTMYLLDGSPPHHLTAQYTRFGLKLISFLDLMLGHRTHCILMCDTDISQESF
uniref:small monomeric GTPase n=1 Tax=Timema bartmani TaxID=61472 RepID=A0A7R9EXB1_9NEOP|nr:unnamed protein product [Timema bartmani]